MSENSIDSRLGPDQLQDFMTTRMVDAVRIMECLKKYNRAMTRKELQAILFISGRSETRRIEGIINDVLHEREIIELLDKNGKKIPRVAKMAKRVMKEKGEKLKKPEEVKINLVKGDFGVNFNYSSLELKSFKEWISLLKTYHYVPFIDDILQALKLEYGDEQISPKYIAFNEIEYFGYDHIRDIYQAIKMDRLISFDYEKEDMDTGDYAINRVTDFMPYILKEHNKRWYLVGEEKGKSGWRPKRLDRINTTEGVTIEMNKKTFKRKPLRIDEVWKYSSGIYPYWKAAPANDDSKFPNREDPVDISFLVRDGDKYDNISYLKTSPIHSLSQAVHDEKVNVEGKIYPSLHWLKVLGSVPLFFYLIHTIFTFINFNINSS